MDIKRLMKICVNNCEILFTEINMFLYSKVVLKGKESFASS